MEYTSLLSAGSDNIFKYLFSAGILMVTISLVYPLQKKQDIDIEIIAQKKEIALLNNKIANVNKEVQALKAEKSFTTHKVDSLNSLKNKIRDSKKNQVLSSQIDAIMDQYDSKLSKLDQDLEQIDSSNILINYNEKKIEILLSHSRVYKGYFFWLLIIGVMLTIIGLYLWIRTSIKNEILKDLEINQKNKEFIKSQPAHYVPTETRLSKFVRAIFFIRDYS